MRALVVDDSAFQRLTLASALRELPSVDSVTTAASGEEAIRLLSESRFDLLSLDVQMPGIDGFTVLRWVMAHRPLPVLVVSGAQHGPTAVAALELGAFEVLRKPSPRPGGLESWKGQLARAVETARELRVDRLRPERTESSAAADESALFAVSPAASGVLVVAASTGGPAALRELLTRFSPRPIPVVVAQHMPAPFTRSLAERLGATSGWDAAEARDGEALAPGRLLVAPGGRHLSLAREGERVVARLSSPGGESRWCPSADLLLSTAARAFGPRTAAVVLTGMGTDGAEGARAVEREGGLVVAEGRETAVVAGMPDAVGRAVASALRLPLPAIADALSRRFPLATLPARS